MRSSRVRVENTGTLSLDAPAGDDEDCSFVDLLVDENAVDPEAAAVEADMCRIVPVRWIGCLIAHGTLYSIAYMAARRRGMRGI